MRHTTIKKQREMYKSNSHKILKARKQMDEQAVTDFPGPRKMNTKPSSGKKLKNNSV